MSPRTNKRVDEFGGCFENRMRFSRLIIEEVKNRPKEKSLFWRESTPMMKYRVVWMYMTVATIAAYLESCGLDAIHVSRAVHIKDEYRAPTVIHGGFSADLQKRSNVR